MMIMAKVCAKKFDNEERLLRALFQDDLDIMNTNTESFLGRHFCQINAGLESHNELRIKRANF